MMKSEYERTYQWPHGNGNDVCFNKGNHTQISEPRMTHKRRVKMTEDNVVIGEPLLHQSIGNTKENIPKQIDVKNNLEKYDVEKIIQQHNRRKKRNLVNEAVQTDSIIKEKSTQFSNNVPEPRNQDVGYDKSLQKTKNKSDLIHTNNIGKEKSNKENKKVSIEKLNSNELYKPVPAKSEYQKKYAWQEPVVNNHPRTTRTSQMMSSLDTKLKIYNNFISEYQRQYRPYEYVTENRYKKMKPTFESNRIMDDTHLKFVPDRITVDNRRRALTPPPPQVTVKNKSYMAADTRNPQQMNFPHGKQKRFMTEYSANFDNKWDRLDAEMNRNVEEKAREANSQAKWFQEILELRKKAQEYRQKSRGTHFSREHLGQVYGGGNRGLNGDENEERGAPRDIERGGRRFGRASAKKTPPSVSPDSSISRYSSPSIDAIIVGRSKNPSPNHRTAGKPTNDDSALLDEEASHDTAVRPTESPSLHSRVVSSPVQHSRSCDPRCPIKKERHYALDRYFNLNGPSEDQNLRTLDYDSVSKNSVSDHCHQSTRSIVSSSTMSLALDTLERAKRNRDELLRLKS